MGLWDELPLVTKAGENDRRPNPFTSAKQNAYLFRDKFDNGDVASIPDATVRASAPGPGELTFAAPGGNEFTVANNRLQWTGANLTGGSFSDEYVKVSKVLGGGGTIAREAGRMMLSAMMNNSGSPSVFSSAVVGFCTGAPSGFSVFNAGLGGWLNNLTIIDSGASLSFESLLGNTEYQFAVVLNSTSDKGAYYFIRGGAYTNWTLAWIGDGGASTDLIPTCVPAVCNGVGYIDDWRIPLRKWLPAADYSIATAPPSSTEIGIGTADFMLDITVTRTGTGGGNVVTFTARQSGSTGLRCTISDAGNVTVTNTDNLETITFSAGVVADTQTWTVRLVTLGSSVRAYVHRAGTTTWTQGTGSPKTWTFNQAVTSILAGINNTAGIIAVNSVKIWKRDWSGEFPSV